MCSTSAGRTPSGQVGAQAALIGNRSFEGTWGVSSRDALPRRRSAFPGPRLDAQHHRQLPRRKAVREGHALDDAIARLVDERIGLASFCQQSTNTLGDLADRGALRRPRIELLPQHLEHQGVERRGDVGSKRAEGRHRLHPMRRAQIVAGSPRVRGVEWTTSRQQLEQDHAEAVDVAGKAGRLRAALLGRHVPGRPPDPRDGLAVLGPCQKPEVEQLERGAVRAAVQKEVFRLQVAVNELLRVEQEKATRELQREGQDVADGERFAAPPSKLSARAHRVSIEQLHHEIGEAVVTRDVHVRDLDEALLADRLDSAPQLRPDPRLALHHERHLLARSFPLHVLGMNDLQRHVREEAQIFHLVHRRDPAVAEASDHSVPTVDDIVLIVKERPHPWPPLGPDPLGRTTTDAMRSNRRTKFEARSAPLRPQRFRTRGSRNRVESWSTFLVGSGRCGESARCRGSRGAGFRRGSRKPALARSWSSTAQS